MVQDPRPAAFDLLQLCKHSTCSMAYRLEDEHAIVGAKQLCDKQLEELLLHTASINAILPNEVYPQGLE